MIRFYMPSDLFATGESLVKMLYVILQDQILHGGITYWSYIYI